MTRKRRLVVHAGAPIRAAASGVVTDAGVVTSVQTQLIEMTIWGTLMREWGSTIFAPYGRPCLRCRAWYS